MFQRKLMRKRLLGLALGLVSALLLALCSFANAQQPAKIPRLECLNASPNHFRGTRAGKCGSGDLMRVWISAGERDNEFSMRL
jgi:hypothetical protein